jgi:acetyl-CoA decarbonylase/synthase complex subunit gamma
MNLSLRKEAATEAQAGFVALAALRKPWVERFAVKGTRTIPIVKTRLDSADRIGGIKARWDIGRMRYSVLPGLYAVGDPSPESPVFVTANYKMSFDALRSSLAGIAVGTASAGSNAEIGVAKESIAAGSGGETGVADRGIAAGGIAAGSGGWILVLDTKGINVWCAAGKGTFGTAELVSRIAKVKLASVVTHRRLILPQLGAPGVAAHEVAKASGFRVTWGPVRAADIPAWWAVGQKKDEAMSEAVFDLRERLAVAPVEIAHAWPIVPAALALAFLFGLPLDAAWISRSFPLAVIFLGTIPVGTLLFPAILPWLPSRAFVVKGAILGAAWAALASLAFGLSLPVVAGSILVAAPVVAFLAMNFTGASTYTCQPGALLEVERGFWPMLISLAIGLAGLAAARIFGIY